MTFGTQGCVKVPHHNDTGYDASPSDFAIAANGELFIGGATSTYSPAGSSSRNGWFVRLDAGGALAIDAVEQDYEGFNEAVLSPADAPIFVTRLRAGGSGVVRTDASGAVDSTFALDPSLASMWFWGASQQSGGKLLLLAGPNDNVDRVVRIGPNGALDTTFASGGTLMLPAQQTIGGATYYSLYGPRGLAVGPAHELYVADNVSSDGFPSWTPDSVGYWTVSRFTADGAADAAFGTGGTASVRAPHFSDVHYGADVWLASSRSAPDLYLVGTCDEPGSSYVDSCVVHLTAAGVDASFAGSAGRVTLSQPVAMQPHAAAVQGDGSLVVAGSGAFDLYVARVEKSGSLDASFGTGGWFTSAGVSDASSGSSGTTVRPVAVGLAADGGAIVLENWRYEQNLYSASQAIVCKLTP